MSVVVVEKQKDKIVLCSDSCISYGYQKITDSTVENKLFKINDIYCGVCGTLPEANYFRYFLKTHKPAAATEDAFMDLMVDFKLWKSEKMKEDRSPSNDYLIVYKNKIFWITYMTANEITDKFAIGCGSMAAMGALLAGADAEEATKIAMECINYVDGKVIKYEIPYKE